MSERAGNIAAAVAVAALGLAAYALSRKPLEEYAEEITAERTEFTIKVYDYKTKEPISSAIISLKEPNCAWRDVGYTDRDGEFKISLPKGKRYGFCAWKSGYKKLCKYVKTSKDEVTVRFPLHKKPQPQEGEEEHPPPEEGEILLHIKCTRNGQPVSGAYIYKKISEGYATFYGFTDEQGKLDVWDKADGKTYCIYAYDTAGYVSKCVYVKFTQGEKNVNISQWKEL